jgi:hypothetical protein
LIILDKTVESYRMALDLESEINRWICFDRALRKPDLEAFEELKDNCRKKANAAGNATNPILFERMVMSILPAQQVRTRQLEKDLQTMKSILLNSSKSQEPNDEQSSLKTSIQTTSGGGGQLRLN